MNTSLIRKLKFVFFSLHLRSGQSFRCAQQLFATREVAEIGSVHTMTSCESEETSGGACSNKTVGFSPVT